MTMLIDRRSSLAVLALGTSMLAASSTATAVVATDALATYLRIRSRLDGKPVFYPYRGTIFGRPIGQSAVPLFDVEGFSWDRLSIIGPQHYRIDTVEAGYFLDLVSGRPLNEWINPLNGLSTMVKHYRSFAHVEVSDGKLKPILPATALPGAQFNATMGSPTTLGDRIWVHEDLIARFPNKPASSFADPREYNGTMLEAASLATWCASVADLHDSRRAFVPATLSYQTVGSWRPFMKMGDTPGVISWRMFGSKVATIDEVPAALRKRVLDEYPGFLTDLA
jgi:hypothetical protein